MEAVVNIRGFMGGPDDRSLAVLYSNVRAIITSARSESAVLYENVPIGQLYDFVIMDGKVQDIPDGAELTIVYPQSTGLEKGSIFVVLSRSQRQRLGGRFIITGSCYIKL